jgi:hypothetical protein
MNKQPGVGIEKRIEEGETPTEEQFKEAIQEQVFGTQFVEILKKIKKEG